MTTNLIRLMTIMVGVAGIGCAEENTDVETKSSELGSYCGTMAADQVCVCTDANGAGTCDILTMQTRFYANLSTFHDASKDLRFLNDTISSIKVGSNVNAWVCDDIAWNGHCNHVFAGQTATNLSVNCWGAVCMNDSITSIRLDPTSYDCLNPGTNQVSIFIDPNLTGDCVVLDPGSYAQFDVNPNPLSGYTGGGFGMKNDSISSVKTGALRHLTGYNNINFQPAPPNVFSTAVSHEYRTMPGWNDVITSLVVN
jgi:hypothetical protein